MLAFIRKWLTSWPVLALLGLVLLAFVVTGVGDPFGKGSGAGGNLVTVGRTGIGEGEVLDRFQRVMTQARQTNPGLTQADAARGGAIEQVTDGLASAAALQEFAHAHGIAASDRAVDGSIASIDAFRVGGKFDQQTYLRLLNQQRMSERQLRDGVRSDLIGKQLLAPIAAGAQVSRDQTLPYALLLLDVHEGAAVTLPPPAVAAPSAAAITAYYNGHKPRFLAPERRGFRYALIDRAQVAAAVTVSDAEVRADFDKNRETYGAVEQRRLSQLVLPDEAKAKAFAAAVAGGQSFAAAAAKATGASATDIALGLLTRDKFAAATNAALADQAFAAKSGATIGPVRTDFGWNVVRVDEIVAPQGKSFDTLKTIIAAKLRDAKAEAALADMVAKIEDGLGSGKSFADAAKEHGLTPVTVAPVGKDGGGAPPAALPVVAKAFDADPADGPAVVELGKGQFALLELGQVSSPATPPLNQIAAQVAAALVLEQRSQAAQAIANQVIADVAKGTPFATALAKRNLPAPKPVKGRRIDVIQQQKIPPPIAVFLTMAANSTRALPATDGSIVMLHVDRIVPGDIAAAAPIVNATRQQLAQSAPDELAAAFGQAVEREVGVKRNPAAIAAAKARIIGEAAPAR